MIEGARRRLALAATAAALAGCAVAPLAPPTLELPALTAPPPRIERWWELFGDPALAALVDEALAANLDLRVAVARIDEARATLRLAGSALAPSLDLAAGIDRNRVSNANTRSLPPPLASTVQRAGLQAAYELDLWGRLGAARDAAAATLLASAYAAQTVRIGLAAEVAGSYFGLRALDEELALTRATLATREENVALLRKRRDAGLASDYELSLAEAERAGVAAALPVLERARAGTESALALLAGRSARAVFTPQVARAQAAADTAVPEVPAGLPSDLLARRPDIRRAAAELAAAEARIGEARAGFYPRLTLTAAYGGESAELADLLSAPARVWGLAGLLLQPLVGLERSRAGVEAATARRELALAAYQRVVQAAFRDVHDALAGHAAARDAHAIQGERRRLLAEALRLAVLRHANGHSTYLEVLDAQRGLLDAERGEVAALRDRRSALVDLYKALGGGWDPSASLPATP